jgi:hypothetical protein
MGRRVSGRYIALAVAGLASGLAACQAQVQAPNPSDGSRVTSEVAVTELSSGRPAQSSERLPDWPMPPDVLRRLVSAGVSTEDQLIRIADGRTTDAPRPLTGQDVEEIRVALLRMGYTTLVVRVPPLKDEAVLLLDSERLTTLQVDSQPSEYRYTNRLPRGDDQRMEMVALDTERDGRNLRWQRWVERRTGMAVSVDFAPTMITPLSFIIRSARRLNPATIYAGDGVRMECEALSDQQFLDVYWLVFDSAAEVGPDTFSATPSRLSTLPGLPSVLDLRRRIESTLGPRDSLFDPPQYPSRVIGRGKSVDWKPEYESPQVTIAVLGFDRAGQWSLASRTLQVIDPRPAIWCKPDTALQYGALADYQPRFPYGSIPRPLDIYAIQDVLSQATFSAVAGTPLPVTVHQTDYRDAQNPPVDVSIDWGDGTPPSPIPIDLIDGSQLEHTYKMPGTYRLSIRAVDVFSLAREVRTTVHVLPQDTPPPQPTQPARRPAPRVEVAVREEMSSFDLFRQCVRRWANGLSGRCDDALGEGSAVLALLPDPGPGKQNQRVAVLRGDAVIEAPVDPGLLDGGMIGDVAKRDPIALEAMLRGMADLEDILEKDPVAVARALGAGSATAFPAGQPDSNAGDLMLQQLMETFLAKGVPIAEREGEWSAAIAIESKAGDDPAPDRLICFKVKRAGVTHANLPMFIRREATIYSMIRVYDLANRALVKAWTQEESVSDLVSHVSYAYEGSSWDSYPPGYMATSPSGSASTVVTPALSEPEPSEPTVPGLNQVPGVSVPAVELPTGNSLLNSIFGG